MNLNWDKEYRDGGSITSDRRFTEIDFNKLMNSGKFRAGWNGRLWDILENEGTRILGKFNPKTKTLFIAGQKNINNYLVEWMTENGFVNSDEYAILKNGGAIKGEKGDVGKFTGKKYGYTLSEIENSWENILVSPNDYWETQDGSIYKDHLGRMQTVSNRNKDSIMTGYAYRIMVLLDLGSKKVPTSAKKYAMSVYEFAPNEISAKLYRAGGKVEGLEKEMRKLLIDLNSSRLRTYIEGDNSEEELARQKEREVKLARYNEVLTLLREKDKYENGGGLERIDLFEDYENIPSNIQEILDKYSDDFEDGNYEGLSKALEEVRANGYTFEYYLDGQAYGLRPIDVPLNELKGYEDMEYAKGGGINSGRDTLFKSKQSHEQKYKRKREWKEYKKQGWLGDWFKDGGGVDVYDFDKKMSLINLDMIYEYSVKLDEMVTEESKLEEWVKMKLTKVEQNISDVKHSLSGWEKFEKGGMIFKKQLLHISKYAKDLINMIKSGSKLMSWQENKLAISADYIDGIYHHLDYIRKTNLDKLDEYLGKYRNGGGIEEYYSDLKFASKQFSKTAEILVKENLNNGEINVSKLKSIIGKEPNFPIQIVGSLKLEKCYLRPYYKIA